eukprot:NODE_7412_length_403_cov_33.062147_g5753_i0.p1 GENE.NODE_7412_length_403_cov_33.062147_g5753_i0~~NODE_7412_length_403_cov_33.062147_g5753_i0.p1  ORF type:complete len:97 (+),score=18.37 NODE_7412_length_403_cov_33.062147_g5753_i0:76-366(+)
MWPSTPSHRSFELPVFFTVCGLLLFFWFIWGRLFNMMVLFFFPQEMRHREANGLPQVLQFGRPTGYERVPLHGSANLQQAAAAAAGAVDAAEDARL